MRWKKGVKGPGVAVTPTPSVGVGEKGEKRGSVTYDPDEADGKRPKVRLSSEEGINERKRLQG